KDRGDHVGEVIAEFATTDSGSDEDISLGISIPIGFRFYIDTVGKTGNVMDYNLYKDAYGNIDYDGTFFKCVKNKEKFS
ncbi:MAG: hypothetical protein K5644_10370, partial [Lachnospiraceae bacterium]|nr:hypothetical protein [Lachnospiraceae bacterium]